METLLGKYLSKLRLDRNETLRVMAKKVGVSSAYLSAVENGKKNLSEKILNKLIVAYKLNDNEKKKLKEVSEKSQTNMRIEFKDSNPMSRELAFTFARKFDNVEEDDIKEILKILNKKANGDD